jgi:hypothetical protein
MSARISKLAIEFAAAAMTLWIIFGPMGARAQDMPGAAPPPATGNPDYWAPPPRGPDFPSTYDVPSYGKPQYSCSCPWAPPDSGYPPCPRGVCGKRTPLTPEQIQKGKEEDQKAMEACAKKGGCSAEPDVNPVPVPQTDPALVKWMNSPTYKAWAATHVHHYYNCGHPGPLSTTPCPGMKKWVTPPN